MLVTIPNELSHFRHERKSSKRYFTTDWVCKFVREQTYSKIWMVNEHTRFDFADCGYVLTLQTETVSSSETLLNPFQITRCYNPGLRSSSELVSFGIRHSSAYLSAGLHQMEERSIRWLNPDYQILRRLSGQIKYPGTPPMRHYLAKHKTNNFQSLSSAQKHQKVEPIHPIPLMHVLHLQ
jgi:hypothetical protein